MNINLKAKVNAFYNMMPSSHNSWTCSLFYPCCRGLPSNSLLANYDWMQNFTFKVSWLCWTNKLVIWCSSTKVCKSIKILWQEISSWNYFQKVILPVYIFSSSHFLVFNFDRRSCNKNYFDWIFYNFWCECVHRKTNSRNFLLAPAP